MEKNVEKLNLWVMVRIVFSGTYDGFTHWYASDLKYPPIGYTLFDDPVYRRLPDRRDWFPLADRADKMGYSFQPISVGDSKGIFFHKILLLDDYYDREGFMRASLFLSEDERIDGQIIKRTLDDLVNHYKSFVKDKAVVEIDWSFVDRKAEELNQKVERKPWGKLPSGNTSKGSTLVNDVNDSEVYAYFTYPNPLKDEFRDYEQVFLTKELLSPDMANKDGGYSIIDKVDVLNPEYNIDYANPDGYTVSLLTRKVKKKFLEREIAINGKFECGEVSKPGFTSDKVYITHAVADEYGIIKIELPKLKEMAATVTLNVVDENQKAIKSDDCMTKWLCGGMETVPDIQDGWTFHFKGTQCNKEWEVTVNDRKRQYKPHTESLGWIMNNDAVAKDIQLNPKEKYTIFIRVPDKYLDKVSGQKEVAEDEKDGEVMKITEELENLGLKVESTPFENIITIEATQPVEWIIYTRHKLTGCVPIIKCVEDELPAKVAMVKENLKNEKRWVVIKDENGQDKEERTEIGGKPAYVIEVNQYQEPESPVDPPIPHDTSYIPTATNSVPVQGNLDNGVIDSVVTHSTNIVKDEEKKPAAIQKTTNKTYYILLDEDSKELQLFREYVTPEEARRAKNKNKRSYVIEGNKKNSVTYERDKHRLVYKGDLKDAPEPTKWEFVKIGKRSYQFEYELDDAPEWRENPTHKYIVQERCDFSYYILLDDNSANFQLFVDYITPEDANNAIKAWQGSTEGLKGEEKKDADAIVACLKDGNTDEANKILPKFHSDVGKAWRNFAQTIVDKKKNSYVIEGNKKDLVTYEQVGHRLVYKGDLEDAPNPTEWEFAKRGKRKEYSYKFVYSPNNAPKWEENPSPTDKYIVQETHDRKLIYAILIAIAVAIMVGGGLFLKRHIDNNDIHWPGQRDEIVSLNKEDIGAMKTLLDKYGTDTRYIGDNALDIIETLYKQIEYKLNDANKETKKKLSKNEIYTSFDELYLRQKTYYKYDSIYFTRCLDLLKKLDWNGNDTLNWQILQGKTWDDSEGENPRWKDHASSMTVEVIEKMYNEWVNNQPQEEDVYEEVEETVIDPNDDRDYNNWKNSVWGNNEYLKKHPKGKHLNEAITNLRTLEKQYYQDGKLKKGLDEYKFYYGSSSLFYSHLSDEEKMEYDERFSSLNNSTSHGTRTSQITQTSNTTTNNDTSLENKAGNEIVTETSKKETVTINNWEDLWEVFHPNNFENLKNTKWDAFESQYDIQGSGSNTNIKEKNKKDLANNAKGIIDNIQKITKEKYTNDNPDNPGFYEIANSESITKKKVEKLNELLNN